MSEQDETGGPAFPQPMADAGGGSGLVTAFDLELSGMTMLDYFAAKAMQGELSAMVDSDAYGLPLNITDDMLDKLCNHWYRIGKSMLKARKS